MALNLAPRTRRPRTSMTPLDGNRTVRARTLGGKLVTVAAFSADGRYSYERHDVPGTPWIVRDVPADVEVCWTGSLPKARHITWERDNSTQPPSVAPGG